ncbi:hypothetical protein HD554DRAFT_2204879 [Boletus coccyginus]|nr:hypothetical protein HD554DRAFT_2204879 [Boletus coccyginus]
MCNGTQLAGWDVPLEKHIMFVSAPPPLCFKQSSNDWTPYCNQLEFETTQFLFSQEEMSVKKINTLLHLWETSLAVHSGAPPFANHQDLYNMIDATPLEDVCDKSGGTAPWMDATYEVHFWDPQRLVWNILKNPDFKDEIDYTPYHEWEEYSSGTYNIDNTMVSIATGQNDYYPLYLSIGNIQNSVRHVHHNAVMLKQLFHSSLSKILRTLRPGMMVPEITMCTDNHYRKVIYGLGPYIADYEEQVVLVGIVQNWCEQLHEALIEEVDFGTLWDKWGIVGDIVFFMSLFPRSDIHTLLAPDLLYQLIKGTFKDHLVNWVGYYLEETHGKTHAKEILDDINRRIAATLSFSDLRHFAEGQGFSQWTGDDSKALMKVYINAIEGYVPEEMHDIITDDILEDLEDALKHFHEYHKIFISANVQSNFVLPRQHAMKHYLELIHLFGAPNGLCSSITKLKHIEAVKRPYQHSSKFSALRQVLLTNQWMDKLTALLPVPSDDRTLLIYLTENLDTIPDNTEHDPHSSLKRPERSHLKVKTYIGENATNGEQAFARNIPDLTKELNILKLLTLIYYFLYDQIYGNTHQSSADVPLKAMPIYRGRMDVFHSALVTFFALSDPSEIGGMHHEHIQATSSCTNSINGMDVARVLCPFSFLFLSNTFSCTLVHWYKCIGSWPDNSTGLWMVRPSFKDDGSCKLSVIHLNSIFYAVHLLPIFDNSTSIHPAVNLHNFLNAFKGYYVNKFADHHAFEILS